MPSKPDKLHKLRQLFPDCVTESRADSGQIEWAVDFERLRHELSGQMADGSQERYHLNWPGKRQALQAAKAAIDKSLRPLREQSVNFDATKNLLIEGDNLEALKLLQEVYLGRVNTIYIDPPYNTGNEFVYDDNFTENIESYLRRSQQSDALGRWLGSNTEAHGRFHSNWLSMIFPRLKLARLLLAEDGIIFVSIDDHEVANLRKVMDEVFGEDNYLQQLVWRRHAGGGNDSRHFATDHEYILVYARNKDAVPRLRLPLTAEDKTEYRLQDEHCDTLGPYKTKSFRRMRPDDPRPTLHYPITAPDGTQVLDTWRWEESRLLQAMRENKVIMRKDRKGNWQVEYKIYLHSAGAQQEAKAEEKSKVPRSLLLDTEKNADGKRQLRQALGHEHIFNNPKPTGLIKHLLAIGSKADGLVLDFFAGSGSTAQAVLEMNHEQGSQRRFILVQLDEPCAPNSPAYQAGFQHIAEITQARIKAVGKQLLAAAAHAGWSGDVGYRLLKVDSPNRREVAVAPDALEQHRLEDGVELMKPERTDDDLLFQLMLDWGLELDLPLQQIEVPGGQAMVVGDRALIYYAQATGAIDTACVQALAQLQPARQVFRYAGFGNSADKINAEQIYRALAPETELKFI